MKAAGLIGQEKSTPHEQMNTPKVYIVILNYLQWQDTKECLESVLKSSYNNFSIIVIDNNSRNNSLEHLTMYAKEVSVEATGHKTYTREMLNSQVDWPKLSRLTFIQNDSNAGFAGGNNIVLRKLANLDAYVWLLNPDMTILVDTLTELVNFSVQKTPDCIIGAEVRAYSGNQGILFYGGGRINFLSGTVRLVKNHRSVDKLEYISGGCLFTHAANFKKYGVLPEDYFLYWEETDWCYRAQKQGCRLLVCPGAICYDKVSTVIGRSFMADYYYTRNGLLFISKYRGKNIPMVLFFTGLRFLKRVFTGRWDRAMGVFKVTIVFFKWGPDENK